MNNYYAKKKRQYRYLLKRINKLIASQEWETLSEDAQNKLSSRLSRLYKALTSAFSSKSLIKAMGTAALVLGFTAQSHAQSFKAPVTNPFSLTKVLITGFPSFVDIDDDGDLDLFDADIGYGGYMINTAYRENTGSATAPSFGNLMTNPFGIQMDSISVKSSFADLDDDGDYDMMQTTLYSNHIYYENTGTKTAPQFGTGVVNPFGLNAVASYVSLATFVDLDNDGDFDLMHGDYYGDFHYYENTGTKTNPQFGAKQTNPFGLSNTTYMTPPEFSDVDGDGDLDLLTTEYYGNFHYFENTGSKTNPSFGQVSVNPFSLGNVGSYPSFSTFGDLDADGDDDILVHDYYGNYQYYENNSGLSTPENQLTGVSVYPNPAQSIFSIELEENYSDFSVSIVNLAGVEVYTKDYSSNTSIKINVEDYPRGVYFVKVTAENKAGVSRLILH
jgi:hypothetical protein